jgi:hypothetical protein
MTLIKPEVYAGAGRTPDDLCGFPRPGANDELVFDATRHDRPSFLSRCDAQTRIGQTREP